MSFLNQTVQLRLEAPQLGASLIQPQTAVVSATAVEFEDTAQIPTLDPDLTIINADYDLGADSIVYTIDQNITAAFAMTDFNGFIIADPADGILPFASVTVQPGGLTARVVSTADEVRADLSGAAFSFGSTLTLLVGFVSDGGVGADSLTGLRGGDSLSGFDGDDTLRGGDGDDTLLGGAGADIIAGDGGNDTASYADATAAVGARLDGGVNFGAATGDVISDVENLTGSAFDDALVGSDVANLLVGGDGADRLFGFAGNDTLQAGAGADQILGGEGNDTASYADATAAVGARLDGGVNFGAATGDVISDVENLTGSAFDDALVGSNGANLIVGAAGADRLFGLASNDTLRGGAGADDIDGGEGIDTASYADATAAVGARLDGVPSFGAATGDRFRSIEILEGSAFDDALVSGASGNILSGLDGNDRLFGFAGRDQLFGGDGDDTLNGGDGDGVDLLDGGEGDDMATYADATSAAGARLDGGVNFGAAVDDIFRNVENLTGSAFDDALVGSNGANLIVGAAGADRLFGLASNDTLRGGAGADDIDGGEGIDTASYADATAAVGARLDGVPSFGAATGDRFRSIEILEGSAFNDALVSGAGGNILSGLDGNDRLFGFAGRDQLFGGDGDDDLDGGADVDLISGDGGDDMLTGGGGADFFAFSAVGFGTDTVDDFEDGADLLDFRAFSGLSFDDIVIAGTAVESRVFVGSDIIVILGVAPGNITEADMLFAVA